MSSVLHVWVEASKMKLKRKESSWTEEKTGKRSVLYFMYMFGYKGESPRSLDALGRGNFEKLYKDMII